ncbi:phosphomannomutase [Mucilaginibacter sp. UYP25]|uniref:HAD-IIB family hydrolase n=1 Tax=unclassified Mucilaginibacter TaxID=2617802 RepID=UPI003394FE86
MKKLIVFDLDGTLAESKAAIDSEMAGLFTELLTVARVAIISGGDWPQFEKQVIGHLPAGTDLSSLSILPTCGTKFYAFDESGWKQLYAENFTDEEKKKIIGSFEKAIAESGVKADKIWGEQVEDRDSQITFSALGQKAPLEPKKAWDSDFEKRKKIRKILIRMIPGFAINLGGATSIDVTKPGIDKAYGMRKLRDILKIKVTDMLFLGDALFEGGNDFPARASGANCIQVRDPEETKKIIATIIACQK